MKWDLLFFLNSALLGIGLAMDAFSVSLTNGMNEPSMKAPRMCKISGVYSFFQFAMPLIGWICVHTIVTVFGVFEKFIPWIALILLLFIGGKMLVESLFGKEEAKNQTQLSFGTLIVQGVATSIDALSVGFTIASYGALMAFVAALIIAVVTFAICYAGITIGKKLGTKLAGTAGIIGGVILILIGIEIFVKGVFFP